MAEAVNKPIHIADVLADLREDVLVDQPQIFKVKEILGQAACLYGIVSSSMLRLSKPEEANPDFPSHYFVAPILLPIS